MPTANPHRTASSLLAAIDPNQAAPSAHRLVSIVAFTPSASSPLSVTAFSVTAFLVTAFSFVVVHCRRIDERGIV
jgi:hypothetical protein